MVEKQMPDDGGWIEWKGGACPISYDALVDVRHADGTVSERILAGDALYLDGDCGFDWWQHIDCLPRNSSGFIIAYRIVSQSLPNTHESGGR